MNRMTARRMVFLRALLPREAYAELHIARIVRGGDHPRSHVIDVSVRLSEIRRVEQVEDLRSEFETRGAHRKPLADGEIHLLRTGAYQRVASGGALESRRRKH